MATVERARYQRLTAREIARIKELRYMDGMTQEEIARQVGCALTTVRRHAPGRPGKIDNAKLRLAFLMSGCSAPFVARELDWKAGKDKWDGSRVRRTLGLIEDVNGRGKRSRRVMIDAEHAQLIAEAIGVAPWSVGCCD